MKAKEFEYIERNALRDKAIYMHGFGSNKYIPLKAVDCATSVDAVRVIRCKDCDNWDEERKSGRATLGNETAPCYEWSDAENGHTRYTRPHDFCSYGIPRDA